MLAQDINELEFRVKSTVDWRARYREHTGVFLGAAFGFGLLAALLSGSRRAAAAQD